MPRPKPNLTPEELHARRLAYQAKYRAKLVATYPDTADRYPTTYDTCSMCKGKKSKVAKLCRDCSNAIGRSGSHSPSADSLRIKNRQMVTGGK